MLSHVEHVAATVVERVVELLCAPVTVIDQHGLVLSSSETALIGRTLSAAEQARIDQLLRLPLDGDGQSGAVLLGAPYSDEPISPRLAQALVELVISQAKMVTRRPNQHELKNSFVHDLLHGLIDDEPTILRDAKLLGMDLNPPRAVILIDAADYILGGADERAREASDAQVRRRSQLVIGSVVNFFQLPNATICAYIGDGEVAVLKASNTKNLAIWAESDPPEQASGSWANLSALRRAGEALSERLRSDTGAAISVGIGRYHPGVSGLARSYQDARAALSLGRRFHGQNGVHCLDGLGIAAFVGVSDERTKIDLAQYLLSPLDHEPELLDTLTAFFASNFCPSASARELSIHRNTLSYRLEKIASLTGLDPRRFDDAIQIRLALLLRSLQTIPA
jgi:carbohydrate diacid regulator